MTDVRQKIIQEFSKWVSFCGTRSGCPLKSHEHLDPLIALPNYKSLFSPRNKPINKEKFDKWHRKSVNAIVKKGKKVAKRSGFSVGWAAKIINLYLKERCYIASQGRPNLKNVIHPPIDSRLWKSIKKKYKDDNSIIDKTHIVTTLKGITNYEQYETIIEGCRLIAKREKYKLIEVDELWQSADCRL